MQDLHVRVPNNVCNFLRYNTEQFW